MHTFEATVPMATRAKVVGAIINARIEDFEFSDGQGVDAFQEELENRMRAANLITSEWVQVDKVGVHPDNRERTMLVPVDAHDLLLRMCHDGFSRKKCITMAGEIPPTPDGLQWRKKNVELANSSEGLLPSYNLDELEIATARGSHTTAAIRIAKIGAVGVHEKLSDGGRISTAKIVEFCPSMNNPITMGIEYDVIKWELVIECPRLMEIMSRTGNQGHSVGRIQTALQNCNRIYSLLHSAPKNAAGKVDEKKNAKQACVGIGPEFEKTLEKRTIFVQKWGGGSNNRNVLENLEAYERTLSIKRKIYAQDMLELSKIDDFELLAPLYVPAVIKALLVSPPAAVDANGYSTLFSSSDCGSLNTGQKNRKYALEANAFMQEANDFLNAYGQMSMPQRVKL